MLLSELNALFLDSRRRGVTGAKKQSSPATMRIYADNLRYFTEWAGSQHAILSYEALKRIHLAEFIDHLTSNVDSGRWKKPTALQIMRSLKTFFRWVDLDEDCQEAGLKGLHRYLPVIGKNPSRTDIPNLKDVKTFKNTFNLQSNWDYRDYVATCFILDTGCRIGEVCNLRLDHLLLDQKIAVVVGKTGARPVPFSTNLVPIIRAWLKRRAQCAQASGSPYVFVSKYDEKMTATGFAQAFKRHRKGLNLGTKVSAHRLRHVFATNFLAKGGDMEKLRAVLGHTTYEMVRNYLHMANAGNEAMQSAIQKVSLLNDI